MKAKEKAIKYLDELSNREWKKQTGDLITREECNKAIDIALEEQAKEIITNWNNTFFKDDEEIVCWVIDLLKKLKKKYGIGDN